MCAGNGAGRRHHVSLDVVACAVTLGVPAASGLSSCPTTQDSGPTRAFLVRGLTDEQIDLPTRPPQPRAHSLADTIERVVIGHAHTPRTEIEAKLRARA
jgi:hypothetical protein